KKVYVIYPFPAISPFLEYHATRIFAPSPETPPPRTPEEIAAFMAQAADQVIEELRREYALV
ncbi:MAG: hypothetical protein RB148_02390, partial [Armatimonadota bacterium]|nr:hypothetical protein [Armatimonadota bacterium]